MALALQRMGVELCLPPLSGKVQMQPGYRARLGGAECCFIRIVLTSVNEQYYVYLREKIQDR